MKLHHAATLPDWEQVPPSRHNPWQRLAAKTHGFVTPGNISSFAGLCLVAIGLAYIGHHHLWTGLLILGVGRLFDIVDGTLAERSGTKSPLGEGVDASFDKLAALATLVVFVAASILPWPFAVLIGLQNASTGLLSLAAKALRRTIHPLATGKIGVVVEWAALIGFALGAAADMQALTLIAYAVAMVSVGLNFWATLNYARTAFGRRGQ
jgi:phosphatidylglycerophosphate synthase